MCYIVFTCFRAGNTVSPRRADLEATEFRMGRLRHERVRIPREPDLLRSAMQVCYLAAKIKFDEILNF